jgi:hypothetical protein
MSFSTQFYNPIITQFPVFSNLKRGIPVVPFSFGKAAQREEENDVSD